MLPSNYPYANNCTSDMKIDTETAVEYLWQALEWAPIKRAKIFDQIVYRLHRNPRFAGMTEDQNNWRCRLCGHRNRCWRL